jgi:hypothetical protein
LQSIGLIYYLNISKRHIQKDVTSATWNILKQEYEFKIGNVAYTPGYDEIIYFNNKYYDGYTKQQINGPIDFRCRLREGE